MACEPGGATAPFSGIAPGGGGGDAGMGCACDGMVCDGVMEPGRVDELPAAAAAAGTVASEFTDAMPDGSRESSVVTLGSSPSDPCGAVT